MFGEEKKIKVFSNLWIKHVPCPWKIIVNIHVWFLSYCWKKVLECNKCHYVLFGVHHFTLPVTTYHLPLASCCTLYLGWKVNNSGSNWTQVGHQVIKGVVCIWSCKIMKRIFACNWYSRRGKNKIKMVDIRDTG